MKIKFKYNKLKPAIKKEDFLCQLSKLYNRKYYFKKVDVEEYESIICVSNKHISKIEYVGSDLIYYKIFFDNGPSTTISFDDLKNNIDYMDVKLVENNSIVLLKMDNYDYTFIIKDYFMYNQEKILIIDTEKNEDVLKQKLSELWKVEIDKIIDYSDSEYCESIYNGDVEISIYGKKYKTSYRLIYKTDNMVFAYIPNKSLLIMLSENKYKN